MLGSYIRKKNCADRAKLCTSCMGCALARAPLGVGAWLLALVPQGVPTGVNQHINQRRNIMSLQEAIKTSPEFEAYVTQTKKEAQAKIKELATTLAAGTSIEEMPLSDELKEMLRMADASMEDLLIEGINSELNKALHGCNTLRKASGLPAHKLPMTADAVAELMKAGARDVINIKAKAAEMGLTPAETPIQ